MVEYSEYSGEMVPKILIEYLAKPWYRAKRLSPDVPEYDPMRDGYYAPFELHDEIAARSASSSASW